MDYVISQGNTKRRYRQHSNFLLPGQFFRWADGQDAAHRIGWAGASLVVTAAVMFPLTMSAILFNGAAFSLIVGAIISLSTVIVMNLAALPTRYTIPAFFAGILLDAGLIIASFFIG